MDADRHTDRDLADRFATQGHAKLAGLFSGAEVAQLREEIRASAGDAPSHLDDGGLLFYENVFAKSPAVRSFVTQEKVVMALAEVVGPDIWIRWDQCVRKVPGGAEFPWHQDNAYSRISEPYCQLWVAITESTTENGGLWLRPAPPPRRRLPHARVGNHLVCADADGEAVFVPARPGDVVLFSSLLPHYTGPNRTDADRWAYVAEFMSADQYDPFARPPYFVVAEGGRPAGRYVQEHPARPGLATRARYLPLRARAGLGRVARRLR
jgi:ectoine hydroxylase-related dioxygenase (phytanoyl-CoA dioxygenase family)